MYFICTTPKHSKYVLLSQVLLKIFTFILLQQQNINLTLQISNGNNIFFYFAIILLQPKVEEMFLMFCFCLVLFY